MKDAVISLILTAALIAAFSTMDAPVEVVSSPRGYGTQIQGDTGMVIPGKGPETVEAKETIATPKAANVSITTAEPEATEQEKTETEEINKDDIFNAFWGGALLLVFGQLVSVLIFAVFKCGR